MAPDVASFPTGFAAAVALSAAGDLPGANAAYRRLLIDAPGSWPCYSNLGLHLRKTRETLAAGLRALKCGVIAGAKDARAHTMYGDGLRQLGNFPAAARAYARGLSRDGNQTAGFFKAYGTVLFEMRSLEAALAAFARGQELAPDDHEFLAHRAHVLNALGRFQEALACCEKAMTALKEPTDAPLYLRNAYATVLICLGRCADADKLIATWPADEQDDINVLTVKARSAMLQGQLDEGWKLIAPVWRHRLGARKQMPGAIWQGEDMTGKSIILFCEQGMGDSVQFIRYAPMVAARGARVIVSCQPALNTMFRQVAGVDAVYGENEPLPAADFNCALP
ncbi:MAG: tetratricopeptide repeat protein, partial [Thalassobaculaceae bacterium]